ncbi:hypothetical protein GQ600_24555 [Phytophthora cactorum]|nr:hypothetical protein GQ600_24555 [Phytophthora cactorum]
MWSTRLFVEALRGIQVVEAEADSARGSGRVAAVIAVPVEAQELDLDRRYEGVRFIKWSKASSSGRAFLCGSTILGHAFNRPGAKKCFERVLSTVLPDPTPGDVTIHVTIEVSRRSVVKQIQKHLMSGPIHQDRPPPIIAIWVWSSSNLVKSMAISSAAISGVVYRTPIQIDLHRRKPRNSRPTNRLSQDRRSRRNQLDRSPRGEEEEGTGLEDRVDLAPAWTEQQLGSAYHTKQLHAGLAQDAMIRILRSNLIGEVKGPVSEPTVRSNKLDAVKSTLRLLDEPGIVAGAFEADDPFELSLETIKSALKTLFNRLNHWSVKLARSRRSKDLQHARRSGSRRVGN